MKPNSQDPPKANKSLPNSLPTTTESATTDELKGRDMGYDLNSPHMGIDIIFTCK